MQEDGANHVAKVVVAAPGEPASANDYWVAVNILLTKTHFLDQKARLQRLVTERLGMVHLKKKKKSMRPWKFHSALALRTRH